MTSRKPLHDTDKSRETHDLSVAGSRLTGTPRRTKPLDKKISNPAKGAQKNNGKSAAQRVKKPTVVKDEAAARKAELEKKIRKRVACEEKAFRLVERLLDPVDEEFLQENGRFIDSSHYQDVVEERSISKVCGYPLCSNKLTNVQKQKYRISIKTNKVYDITERKKFCSNHCFKASQYYEKQLSATPVWLREDEEPATFTFLKEHVKSTSGGLGEEIIGGVPYVTLGCEERLEELDQVGNKVVSSEEESILAEKESITFDEIAEKLTKACIDIAEHEAMKEDGVRNSLEPSDDDLECIDHEVDIVHRQLTDDDDDHDDDHDDGWGSGQPDDLPVPDDTFLQSSVSAVDKEDTVPGTSSDMIGTDSLESGPKIPLSARSMGSNFDKEEYCQHEPESCQSMEPLFIHTSVGDSQVTPHNQADISRQASDTGEPLHLQVKSETSTVCSPQPSMSSQTEGAPSRNSSIFLESILDIDSDDYSDVEPDSSQKAAGDNEGGRSVSPVMGTNQEKCDVHSEGDYHQEASSNPLQERIAQLKTASQPDQPNVETHGEDTTKAAVALHQKKSEVILEISHTSDSISPEQKAIMRIEQKKAALEGRNYKMSPLSDEVKGHSAMPSTREMKAQMLMEFIDQKENLEKGERKSLDSKPTKTAKGVQNTRQSEKKSYRKLMYTDPLPLSRQPLAGHVNTSDPLSLPGQVIASGQCRTAGRQNSASKLSPVRKNNPRKSKISKEEVLANIARAKQQTSPDQVSTGKVGIPCIKPKDVKRPAFVQVKETFSQWVTSNTTDYIYRKSARKLTDQNPSGFDSKYRDLGKKVDRMVRNQMDIVGEDIDVAEPNPSGRLPDMATVQKESSKCQLRVQEVHKGAKNSEQSKQDEDKTEDKEFVLPPIDSQSQIAIRRKIVLDKITKVLPDLLRPLKLAPRNISADVRQLVATFRLGSENIMLKPPEWTLSAYILLKMLAIRHKRVQEALDNEYAGHYYNTMVLSLGATESQVHNLVQQLSTMSFE